MAKKFKPKSILRRLQKRARQRLLNRDGSVCIVCGSHDRVEAAHVVAPPINYFLNHNYETDDQLERDAAPFYRPENMVLLCQKCHWMVSWRSHYEEFAASVGPEKAMELTTKALILLGVSLEDLKKGKDNRLMERVTEHMLSIYGRNYLKILKELEKARREHGLECKIRP